MKTTEINFDGLIGPTHNYAGLSYGNLASAKWKGTVSNPRAAALEGLTKMKVLMDLGVRQAVLPPLERPRIDLLRAMGFAGSDARVLETAHKQDPVLLASVYSASSMWAANAATVSPSADTADGRVHLSVANLASQFHRSLEPAGTERILRAIFADEGRFAVHPPLPACGALADEGAANHLRLCASHGSPGLELFVFGRQGFNSSSLATTRFPARQTYEACSAIARRHRLKDEEALLLRQSPAAIDAGAFHCDVVAVANENVLLMHASAFESAEHAAIHQAIAAQQELDGKPFHVVTADENELPLAEAIATYVFNSQLVTLADGSMLLVAPTECAASAPTMRFIDRMLAEGNPIRAVRFVDVRQSMRNGGGPACLRLRVALTDAEIEAVNPGVLLTPALHVLLLDWVGRHYREMLAADDLADPHLLNETQSALSELSQLLRLGGIYGFQ